MSIQIPESAQQYGFITTPGGTHTSRTMMLSELQMLLAACSTTASFEEYQAAVLDENVLLKDTASTRKRTLRGLRELYALDPEIRLFRTLRDLWEAEAEAQPLLALLCALARDSVLRATAPAILGAASGDMVSSETTAQAVDTVYPGRYNENTLGKIGRNTASSWTQSGHLTGRSQKMRTSVTPRPVNVAYALFLSHLCGQRGEALFRTVWARLLDRSVPELHSLAQIAARQGYLEYRHVGDVTEIGFRYLMRQEEPA